MAAGAGRLIELGGGFRLLRFSRFSRPGTGLLLAPLEVFAKCGGKPGGFGAVGGVRLFIHKSRVSRDRSAFKLRLA